MGRPLDKMLYIVYKIQYIILYNIPYDMINI